MTAAEALDTNDRRLHVVQGEQAMSGDPDIVLTTILGSCVSCCLRDPVARIGGMNHFLLPGGEGDAGARYGLQAMELLINRLLGAGARRDRLEAKLFGGGRLVRGLSDIGRQNAEFAERFLSDEGITYLGGSLGGDNARRVQFWPVSGRARQFIVPDEASVFAAEQKRARARYVEPVADAVEFF